MTSTRTRRTSSIRARLEAQAAESRTALLLTPEGMGLIEQRVRHLRDVALPRIVPLLTVPDRDERDVAEFERLEAEVLRLEALLGSAQPLTPSASGVVELGTRVLVAMPDGEEQWVRPVHPAEASLDDERISVTSPLSRALLGAREGDVVTVSAPAGAWPCRVLEVEGAAALV